MLVAIAKTRREALAGSKLTARVGIQMPAGSTPESIVWSQQGGVPVTMLGGDTDTVEVTLGNVRDYKEQLVHVLSEPPISEDQLPPNVPLPEHGFAGGLQDRFEPVGIDPFALEEAGLVTLQVEVTTEYGKFTDDLEIHTDLPWARRPGCATSRSGEGCSSRARSRSPTTGP